MVIQCNKPHVLLSSPKDTEFELDWWLHTLSSHIPPCPIPIPTQFIDTSAFSDASSGTGIALLVGEKWKAWRLLPNWYSDGRDIAWAKSIALELLA